MDPHAIESSRPDQPFLRVLLIEDDDDDAFIVERILGSWKRPLCVVRRVTSLVGAMSVLGQREADVVLLDLTLPDSVGVPTVERVHVLDRDRPIVVLTGDGEDALGRDSVAAGAADYVSKSGLSAHALRRTVLFALERDLRRRMRDLQDSLGRYRSLLEVVGPAQGPAVPEELDERIAASEAVMRDHYRQLLEAYLDHVDRGGPRPVESAIGLSVSFAELGASARDVLRCHVSALDEAVRESDTERARSLTAAGRALALDVVSGLTTFYRQGPRRPSIPPPASVLEVPTPIAVADEPAFRPMLMPDAGPVHVLLVEDSSADAVLVQRQLARLEQPRYRVTTVGRFSDALVTLADGSVEAVLLDLGLPDRSGLDTVRHMRRVARQIPIVVLTGVEDDDLGLACIGAGADDYLSKSTMSALSLARALSFARGRIASSRMSELESTLERYRVLLSGNETTPVHGAAAADGSLRQLAPEPSALIDAHYHSLLDAYVNHLVKEAPRPVEMMAAVAELLVDAGAGPRDLLSAHLTALESSLRELRRPDLVRTYTVTARLLALEMTCLLADRYRDRCLDTSDLY
jgi:DNA-binding response OmpR family regulator